MEGVITGGTLAAQVADMSCICRPHRRRRTGRRGTGGAPNFRILPPDYRFAPRWP
jgi:hypothetical protein